MLNPFLVYVKSRKDEYKRRSTIVGKIQRLAKRYKKDYRAHKGIKVGLLFAITRKMHQAISKEEKTLSADSQHWVDKGWIRTKSHLHRTN